MTNNVSIHASARDATCPRRRRSSPACFNPRVRAGRDSATTTSSRTLRCFNPRVRAGRDLQREREQQRQQFQSTRPRGTRPEHRDFQSVIELFQSTRPRGTRHLTSDVYHNEIVFQSTRPRGTRPQEWSRNPSCHSFNPRVRAGRDMIPCLPSYTCLSFNPRVRAGRDIKRISTLFNVGQFQSTRPRGTRPQISDLLRRQYGFNPRVRAGRDGVHRRGGGARLCFNPRVRAGRDFRMTS